MRKSPRLTLVEPTAFSAEPPRSLGEAGRKFWNRMQAAYDFSDVAGQEMLLQMAQVSDTIGLLQAEVETNGAVLRSRTGGVKANPAVKDLLGCRAFLVRTMLRLGLSYEEVKTPGRPPGVR
jgi:hypothetical protein